MALFMKDGTECSTFSDFMDLYTDVFKNRFENIHPYYLNPDNLVNEVLIAYWNVFGEPELQKKILTQFETSQNDHNRFIAQLLCSFHRANFQYCQGLVQGLPTSKEIMDELKESIDMLNFTQQFSGTIGVADQYERSGNYQRAAEIFEENFRFECAREIREKYHLIK